MIPDELLLSAIAHPTAHFLADSPRAIPLPAQRTIFDRTVARARDAGLRLPRQVCVEWREGAPDATRGAVTLANGWVTVYLSVNLFPQDLEETILHELQHVHDFGSGIQYSRLELEQRAVAFVARVLGWQWH